MGDVMNEKEIILKIEEILNWTDERLYMYHLEKIISSTRNPKVLELLMKIKKELEKVRADIAPDSISISENWTTGIFFPLDTFDYMSILYYEMRTIVNRVVYKEELKRELLEILFLPVNYKNGQRSGFHNHSQVYRDFLNKRKEHAEKIQEIKKRYDIL